MQTALEELRDNYRRRRRQGLPSDSNAMEPEHPFIPPANGNCPVNEIPPEVLSYIFKIGIPATSGDIPDGLELQVVMSHVCQHWRQVAIETPQLWTIFMSTKDTPLEKSQAWVERSKGMPLEIAMDASEPGDEDSNVPLNFYDEDDDEAETLLGSFIRRTEARTTAAAYVTQILDIIIPHVHRWRCLEILVPDFELMHIVLTRLAACTAGAPLLEGLELLFYNYLDCEDYITVHPAAYDEPFLLPFGGIAPKLREFMSWGAPIDWSNRTLLTNLTHLSLAHHGDDVRPAFADLRAILDASPALEDLTLESSGPAMLPTPFGTPDVESWPSEPISVPSLKELALGNHSPSYIAALMKRLHLPALRRLTLEFDRHDYTDFVIQLCGPAAVPSSLTALSHSIPKSVLTTIEELKVVSLPCSVAAVGQLYSTLTNLKGLDLDLHQLDMSFFDCLSNVVTGNQSNETTTHPPEIGLHSPSSTNAAAGVVCPHLERITTTGVLGGHMSSFVFRRILSGCPIKHVRMDERDVQEAAREYLKANLKTLTFFMGDGVQEKEEEVEEVTATI